MNKEFQLTFAILLLTMSVASGQNEFRDGIVVTLQNDTITGKIAYRSNSNNYQSCIFKSSSELVEYFPEQIKGFGYKNDKFYSSGIVEGSFVEFLVKGDLSLYKFGTRYYIKKKSSISVLETSSTIIDTNGTKKLSKDEKWRGILIYYTQDCETIDQSSILKIQFRERDLSKLIVTYNKCKGSGFREYKEIKPWTKLQLGGLIGLNNSQIRISNISQPYNYLDELYNSINPTVGALFEISSPRLTEFLSFQSEIQFSKSTYSSLVKISDPNTEFHDTFIQLSTISTPISFKYSYPLSAIRLYAQMGLNYDFHIKTSSNVLGERIQGNVVYTLPERSAFNMNEKQLGYWGAIGVSRPTNSFIGSLAIRYVQMTPLNSDQGLNAKTNRIALVLIIKKK